MTDGYLSLVPLSLAKWVIGDGHAVTQHTSNGNEGQSKGVSVGQWKLAGRL